MEATPENIEKLTESLTVCRDYVKLLKSDLQTKDEEIEKLNTFIRELEGTVLDLDTTVEKLEDLPAATRKQMRHDGAYRLLYAKMEEQQVLIKQLEKDKASLLISLHEKKG